MKVLFVDGCIRTCSRTRTLCRRYMELHWQRPDTVLFSRTLTNEPLLPLTEQDLRKRADALQRNDFSATQYAYAKEFAQAEEILIGAPYWDCSFPARLKLYLERICVNGITFRYGEDSKPMKLCKANRLIFITTAGGYIGENSSLELYLKEMCALLSIPELKFYKAEGLDILGNDAGSILQKTIESFR